MVFDYSKLLGRIRECGFTQKSLAERIGIAESTMCLKLNNRADFCHGEIFLICEALNIGIGEIGVYFFTQKVREPEME